MKTIRYLIIAVILSSYLFLMCGNQTEDEHSQNHSHAGENSEDTHTHSHSGDTPDHEHEGEAHSHDHGDENPGTESEPHSHKHENKEPVGQAAEETHDHEHEGEAHSHDHGDENLGTESEPHSHKHENEEAIGQAAEDAHDHEHETGDIIPVEGEWEKLIGLETAAVNILPIELLLAAPGQIIPNENQVAIISPFIESNVNRVFVNIGDRVKKGDLLTCLTSPEIGILRAEYDKAKAELEIEEQNYLRKKKLFEEKIISDRVFQEAELKRRVAEVNFNYAVKNLIALGIKEEEIDAPPTGHSEAVGSTIHIYAPIDGVITYRNIRIGQKVDHSSKLFEIINLNNVWLEADIFEKDLTKISIGQKVRVRVSAYKKEMFTGKIFYLGRTLNKDTKTIKILAEIDNESGKLKPGMFAQTNIVVGKKEQALVIAKHAILDDENLKVVFVKEETGYHRHVVKTGIVADELVEILSGLSAGDIVVTKGNYQLKSKLKMSAIDPHAGHSH